MNTAKLPKLLLAFLAIGQYTPSYAIGTNPNCTGDALTSKIIVSTGINHNISDTTLYDAGYGGNSYYTTPNNNVDSFWIVSRLTQNYNPRPASPYAYTGAYLNAGGFPYVMKVPNTVLYTYWAYFTPGGTCNQNPTQNTVHMSQWLSVYSDAGGQNPSLDNAIGDYYEYDRCFTLCSSDSLTFNLDVLGDDLIDTIKVDNNILYIAPNPVAHAQYYCTDIISLHPTLWLAPGRHVLKIYNRDNAGGHLGINVSGDITAKTTSLVPTSSDDRCTPNFIETEAVHATLLTGREPVIYPVPNDGSFYVLTGSAASSQVFDYSGRLVLQQQLLKGSNKLSLPAAVPGIYFIRITDVYGTTLKKITIQ